MCPMQNGVYEVGPNGMMHCVGCTSMQTTRGLPGISLAQPSTNAQVAVVVGTLVLLGGLPVLGIAKLLGATWAKAALFGSGGSLIALILGWPGKASAAQPAQPSLIVTTACPDGSLPVGGVCAPPRMGNNDPDAPPGGWVYNATPSPPAIQQTAAALAAANPCLKSSEPLVRAFQAAAGLAQLTSTGAGLVSPPGTDGRYGGDVQKALSQYVPNAPTACYSNANPGNRPAWWGAPGTFTNP